jgi:hypothetical protein
MVAEQRVADLMSAAPEDLPEHQTMFTPTHVIRRRDLIDLFDTTADLSGYDLDVSRFIRSEQDRDVLIAWRDDYPPRSKDDGPTRDELCSAPIAEVAALLKASKKGKQRLQLSTWNALDSAWQEVTDGEKLRPGALEERDHNRYIQRKLAESLNNPRFKWRSLERVAAEAAITEEQTADLLRADKTVRFSKGKKLGKIIVGLRSRVG